MKVKSSYLYALLFSIFPSLTFATTISPNHPFCLAMADTKEKSLNPFYIAKSLIISKDKVFDPDRLTVDSVQVYERNFDFDWNNYGTIGSNKKKVAEIQRFFQDNKPEEYTKLKVEEQEALGKIYYKLGTYYTHITRQPELAIIVMKQADTLLQNKEDKAWNDNHLAYAYEQKFLTEHQTTDKKQAYYYIDRTIANNKKNREAAFAYCIQGLMNTDEKNFGLAETSLKTALGIYDKLHLNKDDQYIRIKNRLAYVLLGMNDRNSEAITIFEEVEKYWSEKKDYDHNPYAARNHISLGRAYLKVDKAKEASEQFQKAIAIYQNVYGSKSELLIWPYQLLSHTYKHLGDQNLAATYEKKASELQKS